MEVSLRASANRAARFLVVSDPGALRLRSASQTTLTLVLALLVLTVTTRALGQPITVAMLGSVVAMFSSFVVKDRTAHARLLTTAMITLPAIAAVTLAAVLTQYGVIADVGFVAVLFTAVYVRRFGPRGFALGMASFIAYFFSLFLRATPSQIPVLALAIALGVASSLVVRFAFQHEWAGAELSRLTKSLRASSLAVVEAVTPNPAGTVPDPEGMRHVLERLANTALMIEDWLDRNVASAHLSVTGNDLSRRVFDAQQATEQLAFALRAFDPANWTPTVGEVMAAVRGALRNHPTEDELRALRRTAMAADASTSGSDQTTIAIRSAARVVRAHIAVHRVTAHALTPPEPTTHRIGKLPALGWTREPTPETPVGDAPDTDRADAPPPDTDRRGRWSWVIDALARLRPSTRAAIQVAIATSVATVLGELVSPNRWYWAVLSAFVVFTGTSTRGEILTRAGHRIVGTVAGVFAGVVLAALVGHRPPVQLALIVVCVFCAFYLVTIANGLLVFFVTVLLAMLYGLLGTFSVAVLELRIAETCVGAAVGIGAAYFILPIRTRETVREKVDSYLDTLDEVISESIDSVLEPGSGVDLVPVSRRLDTALQELQTSAKPLGMGPTSRARRGTARLVRVLEACDRAAHALARAGMLAANAEHDSGPTGDLAEGLRRGAQEVRAAVDSLRSVVRGDTDVYDGVLADDSPVVELMNRDPEQLSTATRVAVRALDRLDHAAALTRVPV
ncbi:FUSC family protein [Williamsia maris]|uniref:Fusaric acid resistance protein-like n=1 Tax=Williamsia maris TaxID=72806 RepID=A0ABT1H8X8_9NOCA|nr:FUSC family protein [Williamsia maris]MCP2174713.1 Fusaric acid resistance protein-like [Williamsia maris]